MAELVSADVSQGAESQGDAHDVGKSHFKKIGDDDEDEKAHCLGVNLGS